MVSYRAGAGAAGAVQDAAGLVLLPRRLELAATHAGATVLPQLAHAAGSGGTTVPHAAGPGPGAVPDAADRVAVLVDAAGGSVAVLPLLAVLHVAPVGGSSRQYLASVVLWIRCLVVFCSADEAHWW